MCQSPEVSDKRLYPTFARTFAVHTQVSPSLIAFLNHFKWKSVGILYEDLPRWIEVKDYIVAMLHKNNITVRIQKAMKHFMDYHSKNDSEIHMNIMSEVKAESRSKCLHSPFHTPNSMI